MGFLFLVGIILIAFIGGIFMILYRLWRRGGIRRYVSVGIGIFLIYSAITAVWPPDSFYIDEFEYRSGLTLPSSASVIDKDSSYPDFHGDYFSKAVIQLDAKDFDTLKAKLAVDNSKKCFTSDMAKRNLAANIVPIGCLEISKEIDDQFNWVLFSDRKTIYFEFWQT